MLNLAILIILIFFYLQSVLVYEILHFVEIQDSNVLRGVGLCFALFTSEFCKAFLVSLLWAVNMRTGIRVKNAFCTLAFQKIISLRMLSNISVGEVGGPSLNSAVFSVRMHFSEKPSLWNNALYV